jgi:hypothetical protein
MARWIFFPVVVAMIFSMGVQAQSIEDEQTECTSDELTSSRLNGGMYAEVVGEEPLAIRNDSSIVSEQKAILEPGTIVYVASDKQCKEGLVWWQVTPVDWPEYIFGWAVEQVQGTHQLEPIYQSLDIPEDRQIITPQNLDTLQLVATVELDWPAKLIWSPDNSHLAINSHFVMWVYDLKNPNDIPLRLPPIVGDPFTQWGGVMLTDSQIATSGMPDGDLRIVPFDGSDEKVIDISTPDYAGVSAISPDLSRWATANADGSINLWDTQTGSRIALLEGHVRVGALAFSPNGDMLVSGGGFDRYGFEAADLTLRTWNATDGTPEKVFEFTSAPYEVTFMADSNTIAVPGSSQPGDPPMDDVVHLINLTQGTRVSWPLPNARVRGDLSFNPDGDILAVTALHSPQRLILLNPANGQVLIELEFGDHILLDVQISPDGTLLAIAHEGGMSPNASSVELWSVVNSG